MAEGLAVIGLISSIVQLVDFGSQVAGCLKEFSSDSHDLSETLQSIRIRLPLILDAVKRTHEQAQNKLVGEETARVLKPVGQYITFSFGIRRVSDFRTLWSMAASRLWRSSI